MCSSLCLNFTNFSKSMYMSDYDQDCGDSGFNIF